jgi:hypothetical protein
VCLRAWALDVTCSDHFASVAHWLGTGSPGRETEFDSPHSLQVTAGVAQEEERAICTRVAEVSSTSAGSIAGIAQEAGHRTRNADMVRLRVSLPAPFLLEWPRRQGTSSVGKRS